MGGRVANGVVELESTVEKGKETNGVRVIPIVAVGVMVGELAVATAGGAKVALGIGLGDGVAVMGTPHNDELAGLTQPVTSTQMWKITANRNLIPECIEKIITYSGRSKNAANNGSIFAKGLPNKD